MEAPDAETMAEVESDDLRNKGHIKSSKIEGCKLEKPVMREDTRKMLQDFYKPWNEMLAKQLERETWQYP